MKTVQRIRRNTRTKNQSSQAQPRRNGSRSKAKNPHYEKQVKITFHEDSGELFASFELPESDFLKMKANAEAEGISLMQWMLNAVEAKFGKARNPLSNLPHPEVIALRNMAEYLNQAVLRNGVLHQLVEEHLDQRIHRSGADWNDAEYADQFNFGLSLLMDDVGARLKTVSKTIMETAYGKVEVAS